MYGVVWCGVMYDEYNDVWCGVMYDEYNDVWCVVCCVVSIMMYGVHVWCMVSRMVYGVVCVVCCVVYGMVSILVQAPSVGAVKVVPDLDKVVDEG
jgi:hypothetical protein